MGHGCRVLLHAGLGTLTMQTSALQRTVAEYTGTLLHRAEVRTAVLDGEGHSVPVLCMDVELHNDFHTRTHFEQPYPVGQYEQAMAAAHQLKKGALVTIQAPLVDVRISARNSTLVAVVPAPAANQPQPDPQPQLELV